MDNVEREMLNYFLDMVDDYIDGSECDQYNVTARRIRDRVRYELGSHLRGGNELDKKSY